MPRKAIAERTNQRLRTRKELLVAAVSLIKEGRRPSMNEVADRALVSRATAYRYFPNLEALLLEAPLDGEAPNPEVIFASSERESPEQRVDKAESALHAMTYKNEAQLRLMLAHSLNPQETEAKGGVTVRRQNRRTELIKAALEPSKNDLSKANYDKLCQALAVVFGPEAMVVFRDVVPISERKARAVKSWMIRTLVRAAIAESGR